MAENIRLEVVTPEKIVVNEDVQIVASPGSLGEFGVLVGHTPFLTSLKTGIIRYTDAKGAEQSVFVNGGFAEALPDKVTVLTESAEIREDIDKLGESSEIVLVDTPGQIELFAYRSASIKITRSFPADSTLLVFLFDSSLVVNVSGYLSVNLLATSVQLRLNLPIVHVISKSDLIKENQIEDILDWRENPYDAVDQLYGMNREFALKISHIIEGMGDIPLLPVSSLSGDGLDLLSAQLSRTFAAGEDWSI